MYEAVGQNILSNFGLTELHFTTPLGSSQRH